VLKFFLAGIFYFSPLNTFIRKGKDLEPDPHPDSYFVTNGSGCGSGRLKNIRIGFGTLIFSIA
jgi:hypothetical protein